MWGSIKAWFAGVSPLFLQYFKAALKLGIDALLPVAINAVMIAEKTDKSGSEKFDYAVEYVKEKAPKALTGAVVTAVQQAWATKEADGWAEP